MSELDDRQRYRYLQLKAKMSQAAPQPAEQPAESPQPPQEPGLMQQAAQLGTMPFRGYRGVGVGLENLVAHPTQPAAALNRAAQATQQGFKPEGIPETIASVVGEGVPLMPLGGALSAGGKLAQLAKMGGLGMGLSALNQTAEEGKPTAGRTAIAGALSAAPTALMQGLKGAFPYVAGKFTKTPAAAYEGLTSDFKQQFPGTSEAIGNITEQIGPTLKKAYQAVNDKLNARKEFMGMNMSQKEALAEMEATGGEPRSLGRIAKEFKSLKQESAPIIKEEVPSKLLGPNGQPLTTTVTRAGMPRGERLRRLDDMTQDINKQTQGSYSSDVFASKQAIEQQAQKAGGPSYKILQKFKRQWGDLNNIRQDLGRIADPDSGGADLEMLVRKTIEKPEKISGADEIKLEAIRRLEKVTGKPILEPLKNQIRSGYTNVNLSDFVPKGMLGKALLMKFPAEGLASFVAGSPKAMGKVAQSLNNPAGPISKGARALTPAIISRALNSQRKKP